MNKWHNTNSRYIDADGGTRIAEVYNWSPGYMQNAQLISKTPELLYALENATITLADIIRKSDNADIRQMASNAHEYAREVIKQATKGN